MNWLTIENSGLISIERVVAVGSIESAPIRRLLEQLPPGRIVIMTGGRRRQSALILDSGHIIVTPWPIEKIRQTLAHYGVANDLPIKEP